MNNQLAAETLRQNIGALPAKDQGFAHSLLGQLVAVIPVPHSAWHHRLADPLPVGLARYPQRWRCLRCCASIAKITPVGVSGCRSRTNHNAIAGFRRRRGAGRPVADRGLCKHLGREACGDSVVLGGGGIEMAGERINALNLPS
jgi:hypothetical protein